MTSAPSLPPTRSAGDGRTVADPDDVAGTATALRLAVGRLFRHMRKQSSGGHSLTQLGMLATLDRQGPTTLGDLALSEGVAKPTVTKAIADLTAEGLVEKVSDPTDGRVCFARLTDGGRRDLDEIRSRREAWLADRLADLSLDDRERLLAALPVLEALTGDTA
jgi:DNA-binding MarR family transcriptional regulator